LAGLAYETLGQRSPFWLGIGVLVAVGLLVAGGPPSQRQHQE
jgi:hypothetical protein